MEPLEKIESDTAIFFIENEILNSIYKDGADVKLADVQKNLAIRQRIQQGKKMLVLADVARVWQFSDEARKFVAEKPVSDLTLAMAILTGHSMPVRLVANFFINFNKPLSHSKIFNSKEKALEWLYTFK